jgi:hypothetical protein
MTLTGLCSGVLLPAIGVTGFLFARSKSAEAKTTAHDAEFDGAAETPVDRELKLLRDADQVRLVTEAEEGFAIDKQPPGVYGFTCAPQDASPLFRKKIFQSFEVHKLPDGSVSIVGYATEEDAARLALDDSEFSVNLYPDPYGGAVNAVRVPKSRVVRMRGPSRQAGNPLKLEVERNELS